ncbi:hypothetical protein SPRG_19086 [Saprolegnia parasitica CBS 223.65]|uniref:Uncharacterized protein n=1 Tax=Saprolegnia parasitica (strain CBS 223.65) TaxID=695850 RepID=A0A067CUU3_SAPPC|nr:hypothetical protein SPRG_19086 [Saprolegnia parasitica CBS 223.65]KDO34258.1 hypothetical protein SPRG_19086 [Saprolegnia parasitica CBS 223.65]|eukprot:XP_012195282.1 hypothetical protein SPRG_19086 [Saprolegnia parasitica CBS 223.65]
MNKIGCILIRSMHPANGVAVGHVGLDEPAKVHVAVDAPPARAVAVFLPDLEHNGAVRQPVRVHPDHTGHDFADLGLAEGIFLGLWAFVDPPPPVQAALRVLGPLAAANRELRRGRRVAVLAVEGVHAGGNRRRHEHLTARRAANTEQRDDPTGATDRDNKRVHAVRRAKAFHRGQRNPCETVSWARVLDDAIDRWWQLRQDGADSRRLPCRKTPCEQLVVGVRPHANVREWQTIRVGIVGVGDQLLAKERRGARRQAQKRRPGLRRHSIGREIGRDNVLKHGRQARAFVGQHE